MRHCQLHSRQLRSGQLRGRQLRRRAARAVGMTHGALQLERLITVYACDIDGCLAAAGHADFDLARLGRMAELNASARHDEAVPALTIVTGRPHAYVDALTQLLRIDLPISFENGAGLATRRPYRAWLRDDLGPAMDELKEFAASVERDPRLMLQPGKIASLSVFPKAADYPLEELERDVGALLESGGHSLLLDPSTDCVNVLLPGVDKASGFDWLLEELGVDAAAVAGIGDSVGDLGWLERCAVSVAPANAVPEVLESADLKAQGADVTAALAAYEALIAANRRLLAG